MAGILSACGLSGDKVFSGEHEGIIVGSAAFAESQILAEIYAGTLARAGFNARTQLSIGARRAYLGRSPRCGGRYPGLLRQPAALPGPEGNRLDRRADSAGATRRPRHPHHGWLRG